METGTPQSAEDESKSQTLPTFVFQVQALHSGHPRRLLLSLSYAMRDVNLITGEIVDAAYRLHTRLGPGLLESVYEAVLAYALEQRGLGIERQKPISFEVDGIRFEEGFRADLLVDGRVLVELKSIEKLAPVHSKQVLTYLRLLNLPVGLLINFGAERLHNGLHRIVNVRAPSARNILDAGQRTP